MTQSLLAKIAIELNTTKKQNQKKTNKQKIPTVHRERQPRGVGPTGWEPLV